MIPSDSEWDDLQAMLPGLRPSVSQPLPENPVGTCSTEEMFEFLTPKPDDPKEFAGGSHCEIHLGATVVRLDGISDEQVVYLGERFRGLLGDDRQMSDAVMKTFCIAVASCPTANPSDLWHHVIYRQFMAAGFTEQQWKRVSGFALERVFERVYASNLRPHGLRMRIAPAVEATDLLFRLGVSESVKSERVDLFLEGLRGEEWHPFGVVHSKASMAERILDDVPASLACMRAGILSIVLTMDSKSFPPPHGDGVNHGELGGRHPHIEKERPKRAYVEIEGQFDALFSFNLRTPPSTGPTPSGKRIHTLSMSEAQPDVLVQYLVSRWAEHEAAR